jgi:hypothetical protein
VPKHRLGPRQHWGTVQTSTGFTDDLINKSRCSLLYSHIEHTRCVYCRAVVTAGGVCNVPKHRLGPRQHWGTVQTSTGFTDDLINKSRCSLLYSHIEHTRCVYCRAVVTAGGVCNVPKHRLGPRQHWGTVQTSTGFTDDLINKADAVYYIAT